MVRKLFIFLKNYDIIQTERGRNMFGKNLKFYRLRSGLTQQELAERVGIGAMAISNYENEKRQPNYQVVIRLADQLGVAIGALLSNIPDNEELVPGNFRDSGMTETEKIGRAHV